LLRWLRLAENNFEKSLKKFAMGLLAVANFFMFTVMQNANTLSKEKLLQRLDEQAVALTQTNAWLAQTNASLTQANASLAAQQQQLLIKDDTISQLEAKIAQQERDYLKLWLERFAAKSERYIADPDQLRIDFGDTLESADAAEGLHEAKAESQADEGLEIAAHTRRPRKKRNESLPAHLPRTEIVHDVDDAAKICPQHGAKAQLPDSMSDRCEKLVYVPAHCFIEDHIYPKYSCPGCAACGVASAERATGIVEGDRYDTSVAAQIITHKFAYHLPLYRQQDLFAGSGWTPARSTLLNILTRCDFILQPLIDCFKRTLQRDSIVACDDTGLTLLYPDEPPEFDLNDRKQKRIAEVFAESREKNLPSIHAKMWAYRGVNVKLNVFDFTVSRHRDGPELFFENYHGTLLGDCWHGFEAIVAGSEGAMVRAACNAHARRKFEDVTDYPADRHRWMQWHQKLYDLEAEAKVLSAEERLKLRQSKSRAIWNEMEAELKLIDDRTAQVVLPKSELRKALNYTRNHWSELTRYLDDASLPMDNNECEQLMKQVAIGRKNWLFAGSVAGGERNANFITLVSSAHRNDLDIWAYVNDVLKSLLAGETNYEPLLPWNWAAAHPTAIRSYRQEERRQRATNKSETRERRRAKRARQEKLKKR
jgi:transposase